MTGHVKRVADALSNPPTLDINVYRRTSGIQHRSAISEADKLKVSSAVLTLATTADDGGSLEGSHTYFVAYAPGNEFGTAGLSAITSQATGADAHVDHTITLTIPQVVGAAYYDIFLAEAAAPLWVGRITEAQRASGARITAVGTVVVEAHAGLVKIDVIGTGITTANAVFSANVAYVIPPAASYTPIDCTGKSFIDLYVMMGIQDLRVAPSAILTLLFKSQETADTWYIGDSITFTVMGGATFHTQLQVFEVDVFDIGDMLVLVSSMTGQGALLYIWAEAA